jgi:hypothetical protein
MPNIDIENIKIIKKPAISNGPRLKLTSANLSFSGAFLFQGFLAKPSAFYQTEFIKA